MSMWPIRVCFLISILAAGSVIAFGQHEYTLSEIETGRQQYAANCARCHGPDGNAVADADIGHGKFRRALTDEELVRLIRAGIPNTALTTMDNVSEPNAQTIVAYLRSMATTAAAVAALPPGDAVRGKSVFE